MYRAPLKVEAEVVNKSKNKIHETWSMPNSGALYSYSIKYNKKEICDWFL